jgi:hypothetical protein
MGLPSSNAQTNGLRRTVVRRFITVFFVMLAVILLGPILLCGAVLSAASLSEPLARSMTPPTYPNSPLIDTEKATGSWGYTEIHRYNTSDSVTTVDNWYRTNASKLKRIPMNNGGISFDDPASDNLLAHIVGFLNTAEWGSGPSASLTVYPDPKHPRRTQIPIVIAWPAL